MLRSISVLLLGVYLALSVGVRVHLHYCLGRLASVSVYLDLAGDPACACGALQDFAGCCDDRSGELKLDTDQIQAPAAAFHLLAAPAAPAPQPILLPPAPQPSAEALSTLAAGVSPPPGRPPLYVLHRAFIDYL
ncbi:MAG: hypothetical protein NW241_00620 [Bacteroidia bacterium]|nr:hypothetical protein [Bacteroidia bacterium]